MMDWDKKDDELDRIIEEIYNMQSEAMITGVYICPECGSRMHYWDEWENYLLCDQCGYTVETEEYGFKGREDYDDIMSRLYPLREDVDPDYDPEEDEEDDDDSGEYYDDPYPFDVDD